MTQKLKSHELSEEGKRFAHAFGQNEKTVDYNEAKGKAAGWGSFP